jgi:hypothetical protein
MTLEALDLDRRVPIGSGMCLPDLREEAPAGDLVAFAALLSDGDAADQSSGALLARAAGLERLVSMVQAAQARVVGELAARTGVGPDRAVDELQCALGCTRYAAQRLVARAEGLARHPLVLDAFAAGDVDVRRVDALLDTLPVGGDPRRWDGVIAAVLRDAELWSAPAIRRQTERLVIAAEPAQAAARCEREQRERCVRLDPATHGMAWLSAYLPAPEAVAAFTVVDALAGSHRHDGDTRTVDQRRADAFAAVFTTILDTGAAPDGTPLPRRHHRRWNVQVTVGAGTLLGLDDLPGELSGYGPIPADMARRLAQDGTWRRLLTDPVTGVLLDRGDSTYRPGADLTDAVIARDVTCTHPYCGQPSWRCELDHIEPFDPNRPAEEQTRADNLQATCKHHHEEKTSGGWSVRRNRETGATEWTDPFGITFIRLATPVVLTAAALTHLEGRADGGRPWGCHTGGIADEDSPEGSPAPGGYPDEPPF